MMTLIRLTALLAVTFVLGSCATGPEPVSYAEIQKQYESSLIEQPERVKMDLSAPCNDEDKCLIALSRLERAADVITELNNTIEDLIQAHNARVRALVECEYGKEQRDATIQHQEDQPFREQLIHVGKQIVIGGVCGLLLLN